MKRLQLTLRDLFWLVLVVALVVGWWLEHRQHRHDAQVMRSLHEMSQTLMERLQQVEQMAAANAPSQGYSGTLVEIIEDLPATEDADANLDVPSWQSHH